MSNIKKIKKAEFLDQQMAGFFRRLLQTKYDIRSFGQYWRV